MAIVTNPGTNRPCLARTNKRKVGNNKTQRRERKKTKEDAQVFPEILEIKGELQESPVKRPEHVRAKWSSARVGARQSIESSGTARGGIFLGVGAPASCEILSVVEAAGAPPKRLRKKRSENVSTKKKTDSTRTHREEGVYVTA